LIEIFVDAFLYEPMNTINIEESEENEVSMELTYVHHPPTKPLHHYLHAFCFHKIDTQVVDCSKCIEIPDCKGAGNGGHPFLPHEG
jgi:hypothetical protein